LHASGSEEKGKCQPVKAALYETALTACQLRREREHSSAFTVQYGFSGAYSLLVENKKGAFVSLDCAV